MPALARVLQLSLWRSVRAVRTAPPYQYYADRLRLNAIRDTLARVECVLESPSPPRVVLRVVPPSSKRGELKDAPSAWDPEPVTTTRVVATPADEEDEPLERDHALVLQEINGCKTLLLEVIRRAAYDYVLYKGNRRLAYRILADQACAWLFTERPGTKDWRQREREGKFITSFEAICEALDLDPDNVRTHVRKLTPRNVMSVGRPAEYRRRDVFSGSHGEDDTHALPDGLVVDSNPSDDDTIY